MLTKKYHKQFFMAEESFENGKKLSSGAEAP